METFALTLHSICLFGIAFCFGRYIGIKETLDELKNNKKK
jgi:hypothetical protein